MIVYVETNFILELVLLQEEHPSCAAIAALAEQRNFQLAIPAVSVAEAYSAMARRMRERRELGERLAVELRQMSRSQPYVGVASPGRQVIDLLSQSADESQERLNAVLSLLLGFAALIPISQYALTQATISQRTQALKAPDSLILAMVMEHLAAASDPPAGFPEQKHAGF